MTTMTGEVVRIRCGNWSMGRRLSARDEFPARIVREFVWGAYDKHGRPIFECPGVRIEVEKYTICMDKSVLEGLTI